MPATVGRRRKNLQPFSVFRSFEQAQCSIVDLYNRLRTHLSLAKDAPVARSVQQFGEIIAAPILRGNGEPQGQKESLDEGQTRRLSLPKTSSALDRIFAEI